MVSLPAPATERFTSEMEMMYSCKILGGYEDPAHQIFLRAPEVLMINKLGAALERRLSWWRRRGREQQQQQRQARGRPRRRRRHEEVKVFTSCSIYDCKIVLGMAIYVVMWLGQVAAAATCIVISRNRLKKQDYVEPQYLGHDDHQNIKLSLNIFYSLVLAQGITFICMLLNPLSYGFMAIVQRKYRLILPSGIKILFRYKNDNYMEFITGNVRGTLNMDMVTFAKNLAVSNSADDQLLGIRAMDRILMSVEYRNLALGRLRTSMEPDELGKLVNMLGIFKTMDEQHIRGHAARVLLKLSPDLPSYPQILYIISSSLLSTSNKRVCKCNMDSDLVWFGLRILDKLTDNLENFRKATNDEDSGDLLLSTVIDLTYLCGHGRSMSKTISDSWIEQEIIPLLQKDDDIPLPFIKRIDQEIIVGMALNILSKLVALPGDAGKKLREETSKKFDFLTNTGMIMGHVEATRVISCLAVDEVARQDIGKLPEIIKKLKYCLLSKAPYINTTKVAAKLLLLEYTREELLNQIQTKAFHYQFQPSYKNLIWILPRHGCGSWHKDLI
uniref:Uncharacterized protein n=1 Tax=Leersia perrieri TaxID=77586 RepID=A0A0D9WCL0_9ORYZ